MLRVGIAGAHGRLGVVACAAIDATDDLTVAATLSRGGDLGAFLGAGLDVVLDCTIYPATVEITRSAIAAGVPVVIGATGWTDADVRALREQCDTAGVGAMLVPNFSLGAVLMMRFAAQAARVFPHAEIVELHHDKKRDAPSGTAALTAQRIVDAGAPRPPIHSVRLPGLVAHQETIFGGVGETLTIRHDSLGRESFARGMVAAVRAVPAQRGLVVGIDALVDDLLGDDA
jgi:4-hydroxy-tetrahydrodipicolinate reductase